MLLLNFRFIVWFSVWCMLGNVRMFFDEIYFRLIICCGMSILGFVKLFVWVEIICISNVINLILWLNWFYYGLLYVNVVESGC